MSGTLFVVVDGVPFDLAARAWQRGLLTADRAPLPMVSVFPSLTNVAVPALLAGVVDVRPPGYEARYYDPTDGALKGGFSDPDAEPGLAVYSPHPRGTLGHLLVYALRSRHADLQVRWIGDRFEEGGGPWLGYLAGTDGVGHFDGRAAMEQAFARICGQIDEACARYARRHGAEPSVVLCSDHGFGFGPLRQLEDSELVRHITGAGFRPGGHEGLRFALAPMGAVAGGGAWCQPEAAGELAETLVDLPSIELAACRTADGARVFATGAAANVRRRPEGWIYEPLTGDPLRLLGRLEAGVPHDDAAVFDATWDHAFPDPFDRIVGGLTDLVDHPAAVLFSMAPGWIYGPRSTAMAAGLIGGQVGTHGSLRKDHTLGFVASRGLGRPWRGPAVRARDVFRPFADEVLAAIG